MPGMTRDASPSRTLHGGIRDVGYSLGEMTLRVPNPNCGHWTHCRYIPTVSSHHLQNEGPLVAGRKTEGAPDTAQKAEKHREHPLTHSALDTAQKAERRGFDSRVSQEACKDLGFKNGSFTTKANAMQ